MRWVILVFLAFCGCTAPAPPEGDVDDLVMVLSFDYEDLVPGEGTENLPGILDLLDAHDAKATFFVLGVTAQRDPGGVREIIDRGHSIGFHTYFHNLPIFTEKDEAIISAKYAIPLETIHKRSLKTPEGFLADLERGQAMIRNRTGRNVTAFRAPSLVINWTLDPQYFETLTTAGTTLDSSIMQDWEDPRPFYRIGGITEVPVVASDLALDNSTIFLNLAERCAIAKVPMVLYLHPQNLDPDRMGKLDAYLRELEGRYRVTYIIVEDVPDRFG